jgi:tubulin polyglutamylase TTLL6/13
MGILTRRISALNSWLKKEEINVSNLWNRIDCDIVKTIITSSAALKHQYHLCFPKHPQACFILLGFDVLLDVELKPYIIEVIIYNILGL